MAAIFHEDTAPLSDDQAHAGRPLEARLVATYDRIPGLEEVAVRVDAGVVFLPATVLSHGDRALADSLASKAPGVVFVENYLGRRFHPDPKVTPPFMKKRHPQPPD